MDLAVEILSVEAAGVRTENVGRDQENGVSTPRRAGFYETLLELGFVTRARLQPGRKRRKMSEGFSPCCFEAPKMIAFGEFRNSLRAGASQG